MFITKIFSWPYSFNVVENRSSFFFCIDYSILHRQQEPDFILLLVYFKRNVSRISTIFLAVCSAEIILADAACYFNGLWSH